jgi:phenylacetate-CoA ligase
MNQLITPEDIVLISTSARATFGNTCFMGACARIGAQVSLGALVEPELTLALLAEPRHLPGKKSRVSALSIYPSYLGGLVTNGLRLGYRPADFGVERILSGGEIVTAGYKVTDEQVAKLVEEAGSEGAAFELIVASALGAGLHRWRRGLKIPEEAML